MDELLTRGAQESPIIGEKVEENDPTANSTIRCMNYGRSGGGDGGTLRAPPPPIPPRHSFLCCL